ncbi:MAG: fructose-bisphosphate aldolase [Candidatus Lokiarchaeota archaeon]|nr:fructose-bisphosphate aldolase [Candidatus Lokiarchaeota archaeon]
MSSYYGKAIRMERITNRKTGKTIIIPMDHGVTVGPIKGLDDMGKIVDLVAEGGANAVLGHVGLPLYGHRQYGKDIGLILHLNGSSILSTSPNNKVLVNTVTDAIKFGADAVSVHINIGGRDDSEMIQILGGISRECREWGMPLLAMMYPRGENIENERNPEHIKIVTRIGAELGADIVKTPWTGDIDSFREVVKGCPAPVIIAGGAKQGTKEILETTELAMDAGAKGVAYGRNVWQSSNVTKLTHAIALIVHEGYPAEDAIKELKIKVD